VVSRLHHIKPTLLKEIRCPKCHGIDIYLREYIECYGEWSPGDTEGTNIEGRYFKIEGVCSCDHTWTLRGEVQMNEILKARLRINKTLLEAAGRGNK
jgi:hypothetical protein